MFEKIKSMWKKVKDTFQTAACKAAVAVPIVLAATVSVSASGSSSSSGTTSSAITDVGEALTGVIGYMAQTTAAILGDDLWVLGMGFFVISFVSGFVMYLFRVGRR